MKKHEIEHLVLSELVPLWEIVFPYSFLVKYLYHLLHYHGPLPNNSIHTDANTVQIKTTTGRHLPSVQVFVRRKLQSKQLVNLLSIILVCFAAIINKFQKIASYSSRLISSKCFSTSLIIDVGQSNSLG